MARFRSSTVAGHGFAPARHPDPWAAVGTVSRTALRPAWFRRAAASRAVLYLFNRTGSVIPCLVLHGSITAAQDHLTSLAHEVHGVTDAAIGISYLVAALASVLATRGRLGEQVAAPGTHDTGSDAESVACIGSIGTRD